MDNLHAKYHEHCRHLRSAVIVFTSGVTDTHTYTHTHTHKRQHDCIDSSAFSKESKTIETIYPLWVIYHQSMRMARPSLFDFPFRVVTENQQQNTELAPPLMNIDEMHYIFCLFPTSFHVTERIRS